MLKAAVFGVSFSTLTFEVLLARIFAISQWHHLSFMVISVALFGFAASGSLLSLVDRSRGNRFDRGLHSLPVAMLTILCSALIIIAFLGLVHVPLDYFRLMLEPVQLIYLLAVYLLLILPFLAAGGVIAVGYLSYPNHPGTVYFASMTGSALGAIAPMALLGTMDESALVAISALVPLAAILAYLPAIFSKKSGSKPSGFFRLVVLLAWALTCTASIWLLTPATHGRLQLRSSEYKSLSQVLQFPDTHVVESISGIRGRIERVRSPHLRFAPGLSLKYTDPLPPAEALFRDRDQPLFLYDLRPLGGLDFARFTLSFAGYEIVGDPDRVLLIIGAGGLAVACARASNAHNVRILQQDPYLADMIRRHYGLEVIRETPRALLAQTGEAFDVIHIENWGSSLPGADALHQDHLLTVDCFTECLRHLSPQGALVVSHRLLLPPSGTLRLWSTVREALSDCGEAEPERCIVMLRNYDTFTLVATRRPVQEPQRVLEFARRLNFDIVYLNGGSEFDANRFNVFDEPYHFGEIRRLENSTRTGNIKEFFSEYLLDVRPRTDLQPFPGHFLKLARIDDLYRSLGSRLHPLFLAGEVIVVIVFIQALAIAAILLLLPAAAALKNHVTCTRSHAIYFSGIGAGFIFAELLFIHIGTFFLGDPIVSLAVVLAVLLVSSGAGGLWAQRQGSQWIRPALVSAAVAPLLACLSLWICSLRLLALPEFWRFALFSLSMMIPGFAMGAPFPLGMRYLLGRPLDRTFAWAVNGCASVLASIAAAQIAIGAGLPWILCAALASYGLAFWGSRRNGQKAHDPFSEPLFR